MIKNKAYKSIVFDKDITKDDLNEEELQCYNKLMDGIEGVSSEKKDEIAHLMDIVIESEIETHTNCVRCGKNFSDDSKISDDGFNRVYCDECLKKMWSPEAIAENVV